jgi:uncharacterized RDD family membrane protein YckC
MALTFRCRKCQNPILVKYLKIGEIAECKSCGTPNAVPESATDAGLEQASGKTVSSTLPEGMKPPEDIVGRESGLWLRVIGRIIDLGVHILPLMAIFFVIGIIQEATGRPIPYRLPTEDTIFSYMGFSFLGMVVYHTLCEGLHGATLGKLICRFVVVKEDRSRCGLGSALGRSVAFLWDQFFFGLVGFASIWHSPLNQRFGDKWFHTIVMKRRYLAPEQARPRSLFLKVFFISIALDGLIQTLPYFLAI